MRDLNWLYQAFGKLYTEKEILKEDLEETRNALNAATEKADKVAKGKVAKEVKSDS